MSCASLKASASDSGNPGDFDSIPRDLLAEEKPQEDRSKMNTSEERLSSDDIVEWTRFSQHKTKIDAQIKLLEERPRFEVFSGFRSMASGPDCVAAIVDKQVAGQLELKDWKSETETIEKETNSFNVQDMSRLRKIAKIASKRHMSSEDTYLIEITLETLYALDQLRRLLSSRQAWLELLSLRYDWETERGHCWLEYYTLEREIRSFVTKRARWSSAVASQQVATPLASNEDDTPNDESLLSNESLHAQKQPRSRTSRQMTAEIIALEATRLDHRIRTLSSRVMSGSGEKLDLIIDQCQVPDELLDEQEILESRSSDLSTRGSFVNELATQWRQADALFNRIRAIHTEVKGFLIEIQACRDQIDLGRAVDTLSRKRKELLDEFSAIAFWEGTDADDLGHVIPRKEAWPMSPAHEAFKDQPTCNAVVVETLTEEFGGAARILRSSIRSYGSLVDGANALSKLTELGTLLATKADDLEELRQRVERIYPSDKVMDLDSAQRLGVKSPSNSESADPMPNHGDVLAKIGKLREDVDSIFREMGGKGKEFRAYVKACAANGFDPEKHLRSKIADAERSFTAASSKAVDTISSQLSRCQLVDEGQRAWSQLSGTIAKARQTAVDVMARSKKVKEALRSGTFLSPCPEFVQMLRDLRSDQDAIKASLSRMESSPHVNDRAQLLRQIQPKVIMLEKLLGYLDTCISWESLLENQLEIYSKWSTQVRELLHEGDRVIDRVAEALSIMKEDFVNPRPFADLVKGLDRERSCYDARTQELKISAVRSMLLVGPFPKQGAGIQDIGALDSESSDDVMREEINDTCVHLDSKNEFLQEHFRILEQQFQALMGDLRLDQEFAEKANQLEADLAFGVAEVGSLKENLLLLQDSTHAESHRAQTLKSIQARMTSIKRHNEKLETTFNELRVLQPIGQKHETDPETDDSSREGKRRLKLLSLTDTHARYLAMHMEIDRLLGEISSEREKASKASFLGTGRASEGRSFADGGIASVASADVFGPLPKTIETVAVGGKSAVNLMLRRLDDEAITRQTIASGLPQLQAFLGLPEIVQAEKVQDDWEALEAEARALQESVRHQSVEDGEELGKAIEKRQNQVSRFALLASFGKAASLVEMSLSELLTYIDCLSERPMSRSSSTSAFSTLEHPANDGKFANDPEAEKGLVALEDAIKQSINQAIAEAKPVTEDARVRRRLSKLERSFKELSGMATELRSTSKVERQKMDSTHQGALSSASSSSSLSEALMSWDPDDRHSPHGFKPETGGDATGSFETLPQTPSTKYLGGHLTSTIKQSRRSVSESTPLSQPYARRWNVDEKSPRTPTGFRSASIGKNQKISLSLTPNSPSIWGSKSKGRSAGGYPNAYRSNPKSKLDVAVGKIVNRLPVAVKVAKVSTGQNIVIDPFKDESGKYWVGEPDPKLCFCRILRSKTVMVRVGGGWVELSHFIMQHYSHLSSATLTPSSSPKGKDGPVLPWIRSASASSERNARESPGVSSNTTRSQIGLGQRPKIESTPENSPFRSLSCGSAPFRGQRSIVRNTKNTTPTSQKGDYSDLKRPENSEDQSALPQGPGKVPEGPVDARLSLLRKA
ncbi:hypothetical protein IE53DRAFT_370932 [Violaceomyces palustris]|uniref:Uncharacterized protein n=1 Tax=Violaceomyces palustris TaxID=1673888 RepID=A0ACD0NQM4_9BASI|nr:hypothetical protein IE53DRAFT_370932 [Violaceomyces palustris]